MEAALLLGQVHLTFGKKAANADSLKTWDLNHKRPDLSH